MNKYKKDNQIKSVIKKDSDHYKKIMDIVKSMK